MKPRKHHDTIVAWANGAQIQYRKPVTGAWEDTSNPAFVDDYEYRVKPEREYPKTKMTIQELVDAYRDCGNTWDGCYTELANKVIRHAVDAGQVAIVDQVTP